VKGGKSMDSFHSTNPFSYNFKKIKAVKQAMAFSANADLEEQRKAMAKKLRELLAMQAPLDQCTPVIEENRTDDPRFDEVRFLIESEPGLFLPAHLIYPKSMPGKIPLVVCLQGHSKGMHISLAREPYPSKTPIAVEGDRDFCIQAVARGYAALALEQRGFGELSCDPNGKVSCHELGCHASLLGKTLLGERIYDVSNAITAVTGYFDFIDPSRIGVMGNSGGGTVSYYAACLDDRIKVSMPSSSFCSIADAWGGIRHCSCSYINGILQYFEMADLALLIAPKHLIAVNGIYDHLQPFESAKREFERIKTIYEKVGAPDHCAFVVGNEGHRFYADLAWSVFDDHINR
jgi:cephalosporin-C deacetylase-like acetyl esterase